MTFGAGCQVRARDSPAPPNVLLFVALWSRLGGGWAVFKGDWGVLADSRISTFGSAEEQKLPESDDAMLFQELRDVKYGKLQFAEP